MNEDAEKWMEQYASMGMKCPKYMLEAAMHWAYADAARICREQGAGIPYGAAIEERMNG